MNTSDVFIFYFCFVGFKLSLCSRWLIQLNLILLYFSFILMSYWLGQTYKTYKNIFCYIQWYLLLQSFYFTVLQKECAHRVCIMTLTIFLVTLGSSIDDGYWICDLAATHFQIAVQINVEIKIYLSPYYSFCLPAYTYLL